MQGLGRHINWGALIALAIIILGVVIAFIVFVGLVMGGGGCEGRSDGCKPDFTLMWSILAMIATATLLSAYALARLVNKAIDKWRRRRAANE